MTTHQCDNCGDVLTDKDPEALVGQLTVQKVSQPKLAYGEEGSAAALFWGVSRPKPQQEQFLFCGECAMQLLIAIKTRKLALQRGDPLEV